MTNKMLLRFSPMLFFRSFIVCFQFRYMIYFELIFVKVKSLSSSVPTLIVFWHVDIHVLAPVQFFKKIIFNVVIYKCIKCALLTVFKCVIQ